MASSKLLETTDPQHSWLGRWADVGWAIRIGRKLRNEEWDQWAKRADETWDNTRRNYDPHLAMDLLGEMFPGVALQIVWPPCGKRMTTVLPSKFVICDKSAMHTETQLRDVLGNKVTLARCAAHRGML